MKKIETICGSIAFLQQRVNEFTKGKDVDSIKILDPVNKDEYVPAVIVYNEKEEKKDDKVVDADYEVKDDKKNKKS